jgi:starch-binding outer membrane protein, SusD/RagB family
MKKYIIALSIFGFLLAGCKKELIRNPLDAVVEQTAFVSYDNFKTYSWGLYDYFDGYGSGSPVPPVMGSQEVNSDNIMSNTSLSGYFTGGKSVPVNATGGTSTLAIAGWDFSYLRRVNLMLDHVNTSSMSDADKKHWRSVGLFFRSLRYYDLMAAFGDVPWIEHATSDTSNSVLYGPRTSRDTVAQHVLSDLIWAEENIKVSGDGANTINRSCVQFLISRFGLFEGTWRKYHNLPNAATYLNASVNYSQKLLASFGSTTASIMSSYDDVYNTRGLVGKPGIILAKQYLPANYTGPGNNGSNHQSVRYCGSNSASWTSDVTRSAVESYLCTDGRPISTSTVYKGDDSMYSAFRNRDRRLYFTVIPPYRIKYKNPNTTLVNGGYSDTVWTYDTNPEWGYFIHYMNDTIKSVNKRLPLQGFSIDMASGDIIPNIPHFTQYANTLSSPTGKVVANVANYTGYYYWKLYNRLALTDGSNLGSTNDAPVFRLEEVMLNYAEAQYELGAFTQTIADQTINVLRQRANPTSWPAMKMDVARIDASFDARRDVDVDPVLWEIRRERRVELFGDGFRFNDIKRWGKGNYMTGQAQGVKVKNSDYGGKLTIAGGSAIGYVIYQPAASGWKDAYYLEPVPSGEILLNPKLVQNPGYPQ